MEGGRIELVNKKINELISKLRQDPHALEAAYIFVASYNMDMRVCLPLTELASINVPVLKAKPSSPSMLGNALSSIAQLLEEITKKKTTDEFRKDYPILYIFTGGKPSDSRLAHDALEQLFKKRRSASQPVKVVIGLTSQKFMPFYENTFDFFVKTGDLVITDLNIGNGYWTYMDFIVGDSLTEVSQFLNKANHAAYAG